MDKKKNTAKDEIVIKGARTHNLRNIDLTIPRNKMVVISGLSGSGKSSLAFDTIFAEGQRKYIESLSAYARQFLRQLQKPDVDEITGLSPAISIDQKSRSNNPRSTVATITEIYDYLRILFARVGKPHCLLCDREIKKLKSEINNPELWKIDRRFNSATYFLYTDEQLKKYQDSELHKQWNEQYFDLLKKYDEFGYFKKDFYSVFLDSKENFDTNYESNWYYYYK